MSSLFIYCILLLLYSLSSAVLAVQQQQVPFHHPSPSSSSSSSLLQTLSLKRLYYHDPQTSTLARYQKLPSGSSSAQKLETTYRIRPVIEHYAKPSKASIEYLLQSQHSTTRWQTVPLAYTKMELVWDLSPDVTNCETVLNLAKMSYDSYTVNDTFGWDADGLRGHVFGNADDSLLVIAIKGTTAGLFTGGPTGDKDKLNDNLLFSCCCARISRVWTPVCDCYQNNDYVCEEQCVEKAILKEELYYDHALDIFKDISDQYPNASLILTGHSLGGALAALVGHTFGAPAVSFEAPGERLAAKRLHLPTTPGVHTPVYHFGHTADPIFVGLCTGISSSCWYGGFAIETRCHSGKACVWDTVNEHGWKVDVRSHQIGNVIDKILLDPENFPLPRCMEQQDCIDCALWKYPDDRDSVAFTGTNISRTSLGCSI
ncbi:unnamed protein product [Absidia cylindrospora]